MAKATITEEKTKTTTVVVEPAKVTLELTEDEAVVLRTLLGKFLSGGPTSSMWHALNPVVDLDYRAKVTVKNSWGDQTLIYTPGDYDND